jgi:hypothetical protein
MFRSMSRTAAVAVVALTLVLLSVPAVHARPIERSGPSIDAGSWMDGALSWLSSLLFGDQPTSQNQTRSTFDAVTGITLDGYYQPNSGGCIDPEGRPRPCTGF